MCNISSFGKCFQISNTFFFVIRLMESSISKLATGEISNFELVPKAEQTG